MSIRGLIANLVSSGRARGLRDLGAAVLSLESLTRAASATACAAAAAINVGGVRGDSAEELHSQLLEDSAYKQTAAIMSLAMASACNLPAAETLGNAPHAPAAARRLRAEESAALEAAREAAAAAAGAGGGGGGGGGGGHGAAGGGCGGNGGAGGAAAGAAAGSHGGAAGGGGGAMAAGGTTCCGLRPASDLQGGLRTEALVAAAEAGVIGLTAAELSGLAPHEAVRLGGAGWLARAAEACGEPLPAATVAAAAPSPAVEQQRERAAAGKEPPGIGREAGASLNLSAADRSSAEPLLSPRGSDETEAAAAGCAGCVSPARQQGAAAAAATAAVTAAVVPPPPAMRRVRSSVDLLLRPSVKLPPGGARRVVIAAEAVGGDADGAGAGACSADAEGGGGRCSNASGCVSETGSDFDCTSPFASAAAQASDKLRRALSPLGSRLRASRSMGQLSLAVGSVIGLAESGSGGSGNGSGGSGPAPLTPEEEKAAAVEALMSRRGAKSLKERVIWSGARAAALATPHIVPAAATAAAAAASSLPAAGALAAAAPAAAALLAAAAPLLGMVLPWLLALPPAAVGVELIGSLIVTFAVPRTYTLGQQWVLHGRGLEPALKPLNKYPRDWSEFGTLGGIFPGHRMVAYRDRLVRLLPGQRLLQRGGGGGGGAGSGGAKQ